VFVMMDSLPLTDNVFVLINLLSVVYVFKYVLKIPLMMIHKNHVFVM